MRALFTILVILSVAKAVRARIATDVAVSTTWLKQHLNDRDLVMIQVGRKADYDKEHIAGTRLMTDGGLESSAMGSGAAMDMSAFPSETELHGKLEKLGVSNGSHVVVVFTGSANEVVNATRTIFLMRYAGVDNVSLLDGGLGAWKQAGLPVTAAVPVSAAGHFTVPIVATSAVDFGYVQSHLTTPHFKLIDARDATYFSGGASAGMGMAAGHIPGAHNIPYGSLIGDSGVLIPRAAIEAKFRAAGVQPGDTVIAYCHVGLQATVVVLSARAIGQPVKMYLGAFHDWSAHKLPTEGGTP